MEDTIAAREAPPAQIPNPAAGLAPTSDPFNSSTAVPPAAPPVPPLPQHAAAPSPPPPNFYGNSRKRGLDSDARTRDGNYLKIRAVVKDIRPHMLEVIRMADFRSSKGAHEIREKLKVLMELCKQMTAETGGNTKSRFATEGQQHSLGENGGGQNRAFLNQIVGASAFGWNFITFPDSGGEPVYYGRTKESFRAAQAAAVVS